MLTANSTLQHGRYRIIRPVAQGGMGAVYEAYDNNLKNRIALKEALLTEPELRRAFEREAQRLDRLRHVGRVCMGIRLGMHRLNRWKGSAPMNVVIFTRSVPPFMPY